MSRPRAARSQQGHTQSEAAALVMRSTGRRRGRGHGRRKSAAPPSHHHNSSGHVRRDAASLEHPKPSRSTPRSLGARKAVEGGGGTAAPTRVPAAQARAARFAAGETPQGPTSPGCRRELWAADPVAGSPEPPATGLDLRCWPADVLLGHCCPTPLARDARPLGRDE